MRAYAIVCGLVLLAGCENTGPTYATGADEATLSLMAGQMVGTVVNSYLVPVVGEPLVLTYDQGTPVAAHTMVIRFLARAIASGSRPLAVRGPVAVPLFRSLSPSSTCVPTISGIGPDSLPIDSDEDGVPDDWKIDYGTGCADLDSAGTHGIIYEGSVEFLDTGVGFKSGKAIITGFRATTIGQEAFGTVVNWTEGTETFDFTPNRMTDVMHLKFGQTIPGSADHWDNRVEASFVPDPGNALALGAPLPTGDFTYDGDVRHIIDHDDYGSVVPTYRMKVHTTDPLHLNTGCNGFVDAGQLEGWLNGDPQVGFRATFPGCGEPYVTEVFGATP